MAVIKPANIGWGSWSGMSKAQKQHAADTAKYQQSGEGLPFDPTDPMSMAKWQFAEGQKASEQREGEAQQAMQKFQPMYEQALQQSQTGGLTPDVINNILTRIQERGQAQSQSRMRGLAAQGAARGLAGSGLIGRAQGAQDIRSSQQMDEQQRAAMIEAEQYNLGYRGQQAAQAGQFGGAQADILGSIERHPPDISGILGAMPRAPQAPAPQQSFASTMVRRISPKSTYAGTVGGLKTNYGQPQQQQFPQQQQQQQQPAAAPGPVVPWAQDVKARTALAQQMPGQLGGTSWGGSAPQYPKKKSMGVMGPNYWPQGGWT